MPEPPQPAPEPPQSRSALLLSLLLIPAVFVALEFWARDAGGPFWLWFNLDPDYFYLLDALNLVTGTVPGHVYHPGTTVHGLAALILAAANPGAGADGIVDGVLAAPEPALRLISAVFIALNGAALAAVGWAGLRTWREPIAAWLLQLAPLMSMLIVKHAFHVKPEAILVLATLALIAVTVLALEPGALERRYRVFAIAFGVVAGFGVATKVTAAPVFVLPVFVLWRRDGGTKAVALYAGVAAVALVVFFAPALGAADVFLAWMAKVAGGSGAYGGGVGGIDAERYGAGLLKMIKRPALHGVLFVGLGVLACAWARRRRQTQDPAEVRALAGVVATIVLHVLFVAKQPNATYLVPSLMLAPLGLVLAWRVARRMTDAAGPWPGRLNGLAGAVLAALVVAQGMAVTGLHGELTSQRRTALSLTDGDFGDCARIHAYASSSPAFALLLADYVTGSRFAARLAATHPKRDMADDYWFEHWWDQSRMVFRSWSGPTQIAPVLARDGCIVVRATHWDIIERHLAAAAPGLAFDARCPLGTETLGVRGTTCGGGR